MKTAGLFAIVFLSAMVIIGCPVSGDNEDSDDDDDSSLDLDIDTDADTDTDTDVDMDVDGDTDTGGGTFTPAIQDPCSDFDTAGEYGVDGGPDIALPAGFDFDLEVTDATVLDLNSAATGPVVGNEGDGEWYLERLGAREGLNGGNIATGPDGSYKLTLPLFCGEQILKSSWSNAAGQYCLVQTINNLNCLEGDIRVTLSWGAGAYDLELHLIRAGGQINNQDGGNSDCTWTNMNPDWGVASDTADNPQKDVDWTGENGIENIYLPNPENIVYHVFVEYWASGVPITGNVVFNVDGETTVAELPNFNSKEVWHVGTIDWSARRVTLINDVTDCSGNWSSGCLLDIP